MSEVGSYDISIVQGESWKIKLTLTEDDGSVINLTDYLVKMQIRQYYNDTVIQELTIANNGIDMSEAISGIVYLIIAKTDTVTYDFSDAMYDIRFIKPVTLDASYILEGKVEINRSITIDE